MIVLVMRTMVRSQIQHWLVSATLLACAWAAREAADGSGQPRGYELFVLAAVAVYAALAIVLGAWSKKAKPSGTPGDHVKRAAAEDGAKIAKGVARKLAWTVLESKLQAVAQIAYALAMFQLLVLTLRTEAHDNASALVGGLSAALALLAAAGASVLARGLREDDADMVGAGLIAVALAMLALIAAGAAVLVRVGNVSFDVALPGGPSAQAYGIAAGVLLAGVVVAVLIRLDAPVRRAAALAGLLVAVPVLVVVLGIEVVVPAYTAATATVWTTWTTIGGLLLVAAAGCAFADEEAARYLGVAGGAVIAAEVVTWVAVRLYAVAITNGWTIAIAVAALLAVGGVACAAREVGQAARVLFTVAGAIMAALLVAWVATAVFAFVGGLVESITGHLGLVGTILTSLLLIGGLGVLIAQYATHRSLVRYVEGNYLMPPTITFHEQWHWGLYAVIAGSGAGLVVAIVVAW